MNGYDELQLYISNNFESFKEVVINELINYYGEKYRDQIIARINNTGFVFYVNPNLKLKSEKNNNQLKHYYKLIREDIIKNNRDEVIFNSTNRHYAMNRRIINKNFIGFSYFYNRSNKCVDTVIHISLFSASDEDIVHEMIHACMGTPLVLVNYKDGDDLIYKNGINVTDHFGESFLEEILTQIDARIVEKKVKEKGVSLINKIYPHDHFISFYNNFIPFVNSFYSAFKDEINEARLTLNLRKLIDTIGEENYCKYIDLIQMFYDDYYDCDKGAYKHFLDSEVKNMRKTKYLTLSKN